jgi:hypothetical protein
VTQDQQSRVPATVSFQTQPRPASKDAEESWQPSIYHNASPVTISRPNPDGSAYLDIVSSLSMQVFDHAKPANINTTHGTFRP